MNLTSCVGNQVLVAILLGVGCESHDVVHSLYKRKFSQAWPMPRHFSFCFFVT